ncbi:MAG: hypothetical protein KatS3mg043_0054 [Rhodothermaceae bacterium]|nr:MAG: hypothetical protein KatS3mg043_0054 [Rhodothermaceae bacterium]
MLDSHYALWGTMVRALVLPDYNPSHLASMLRWISFVPE